MFSYVYVHNWLFFPLFRCLFLFFTPSALYFALLHIHQILKKNVCSLVNKYCFKPKKQVTTVLSAWDVSTIVAIFMSAYTCTGAQGPLMKMAISMTTIWRYPRDGMSMQNKRLTNIVLACMCWAACFHTKFLAYSWEWCLHSSVLLWEWHGKAQETSYLTIHIAWIYYGGQAL